MQGGERLEMRTKFMMCLVAGAGMVADATSMSAQALERPDGWRTEVERFVAMPPGFHITTSASSLLYHPEATVDGEFVVESEGYLFAGDSPHAYGIFVGGRELGSDAATWTSFEIALDGTWTIRSRRAEGDGLTRVEVVAGPRMGPVALPAAADSPALNSLRIETGGESVKFFVNDQLATNLPRSSIAVDGIVGFRIGAALNLHLTTLSITNDGETVSWAPQPADETDGEPTDGGENGL